MKRCEMKNTHLRPYIERSAKACVSNRSNNTDGQKKRNNKTFVRLDMWFTNRILSKASGLFEFVDFCLSGILANIHEYF